MRAFVAFELPPSVLDSLAAFQDELSGTGADLKVVEKENLHFTVKFLGEITESQAAEADSRLKKLKLERTHVAVKGVGAFPSSTRPRVVWAGLPPEHEALLSPVARSIISALEGIGERDDRPFQAHVTVARVRSSSGLGRLQELIRTNADRDFGEADVKGFKLKSSLLTPRGPIYRDFGGYDLA